MDKAIHLESRYPNLAKTNYTGEVSQILGADWIVRASCGFYF